MQVIIKNLVKDILPLILFILVIGGIWIGATTIIQNDTPFFVVSSGSMKPVLQIGDIIIVNGRNHYDELEVGDIVPLGETVDSFVKLNSSKW